MTTMKRIVIGCTLGLLTFAARAQETVWVLNDLAYALENPDNRTEVVAAMKQFQKNTAVTLSVSAEFERGVYATDARQQATTWLQKQPHGITVFITLSEDTKAFRECTIAVSQAVAALLPAEDQERIRTGLMEFYFRSSPIPTDAYTRGLLAGIAAMEKRILEGKENEAESEQEKLPDLVEITDIDEEFSAGMVGYSGNTLKISYAMKKDETYALKVAKFEVYDVHENLVYNSEKEENRVLIKEKGHFTWDGKMNAGTNAGKFIQYEDSPFMVKLIASTNALYENVFEADAISSVDEDVNKWNNFKFKDAISDKSVWSYTAFKSLDNHYKRSMKSLGLERQHPLDYLNESLVSIRFLGQGPISLNIRFAYVLKLLEQSINSNKRAEYEQYFSDVEFSSTLRMTQLGDGVSSHALGFALDLDAVDNPMIVDEYLYDFIEFITGLDSFYGRRERTHEFVDELKNAHQIFIDRLKIDTQERITWINLLESAEKIKLFEDRGEEDDEESKGEDLLVYLLSDIANNKPLYDIEDVHLLVEGVANRSITKMQILDDCNRALNNLSAIEKEIAMARSVINEYESGMLRKHFVPTEMESTRKYLDLVDSRVASSRTSVNNLIEYVSLTDMEQLLQDFVSFIDSLFKEEQDKQLRFSDSESNLVRSFCTHITGVYASFEQLDGQLKDYRSYLKKIKSQVDGAGIVTGKKLMSRGFFNLRADFIKDWLAVDYSYWGGFYTTNHDFMHIEVINGWKNRALDRLHKQEIDFYRNFFRDNYPNEYQDMFHK